MLALMSGLKMVSQKAGLRASHIEQRRASGKSALGGEADCHDMIYFSLLCPYHTG